MVLTHTPLGVSSHRGAKMVALLHAPLGWGRLGLGVPFLSETKEKVTGLG